jgi:hypothetical protein
MNSMRKPSGSATTRKPPAAADSHVVIEDWIGSLMPGLQPIVRTLDESIRKAIPDLQYAIKWKKSYYGLPDVGWMMEIVAYDVSVNLVFFGGADFDSPPPLGDTDRSRYVKVKTLEEARAPAIRGWIAQAKSVPGWH